MRQFKFSDLSGVTTCRKTKAFSLTLFMAAALLTFMISGCEKENEKEIIKGKGWFSLTLAANPSDAGTFTASCDISEEIKEGKTVLVTPKPALNYYFSEWTGDINDNTEILELAMDDDKNIVAEFLPGVNETFQDDSADYFVDDQSGRWAVNDTGYVMTGSKAGGWTYSMYNSSSYDNFEVSVDINIDEMAEGAGNPAGIYFRSQAANPETNAYWVVLNTSGKWYMLKENAGSYTFIQNWTTSTDCLAGVGNRNNLKVVCNGNTFEVFINGVSQASLTDDTFSSGYVGLFGYDSSTYTNVYVFDNFAVRPITAEKSMSPARAQTPDVNQSGDPRFD